MDDTKLLELAGRAAGEQYDAANNPLERDDLALRLAVKLSINMEHMRTMGGDPFGFSCWPIGRGDCGANETDIADYGAAVRRAITRAAAELARAADAGGKEGM